MTNDTSLSEYIGDEDELRPIDRADSLYRIRRTRTSEFDDEVLFVRVLSGDDTHDWEALRETDTRRLEREFYDDDTPNRWNIQLFWAYEKGAEPDEEVRRELESETRFAIRRCVPRDSLRDFLQPLEYTRERLSDVNDEFGREALVQRVTGNGLGFLFDQSTSRDEKIERLLNLDTEDDDSVNDPSFPETTDDQPPQIDTVELGDFRPDAGKRQLDAAPFTLLYGRNGTGKTSLLDETTMGLVGQTRRDDDRVDSYDGLGVTLDGDNEPLKTDSPSVNDRVADWFGFRPQGPATRCVEFYRVNYHEAGETTRLLEPSTDLEIERVFQNFLYGEDLAYAKKEKNKLLDQLTQKIDGVREEIEQKRGDRTQLQDRQEAVQKALSTLGSARRDLSPAAAALVAGDNTNSSDKSGENHSGRDEETQDQIARWKDWQRRLQWIERASNAAIFNWTWETPRELRSKLGNEVTTLTERRDNLNDIRELKDERRRVAAVTRYVDSAEIKELPFSVFFTGLVLTTVGEVGHEDARKLAQGINETEGGLKRADSLQSFESWFKAIESELRDRRTELVETREKITELNDLAERQRKLREQIRADTEEYLRITNDENINYCPACYVEQSAEKIRTRGEPEHVHDASGAPEELSTSLETVETALDIVESSNSVAIDNILRRHGNQLCEPDDVLRLLELITNGREEILFPEATYETVKTITRLSLGQIDNDHSVNSVLSSILNDLDTDLSNRTSEVGYYNPELTIDEQVDDCEERLSAVQTGLGVLEDQWPEELLDTNLAVESDVQRLESVVSETEAAAVPDSLSDLSSKIESKAKEIDSLKNSTKQLKEKRDYLKSTFMGVGEGLDKVLKEYTGIVATLFKVFQRPYEFDQVKLTGDNDQLRVIRRENGETAKISEMSSGQRTALLLAIFVTNNLAHDTAPPLMLLDEPFAHLDELNTLSFFNLVIELAVRGDRQIIFATANESLASLLERKIGETAAFERVNLGGGTD